MLAILNLGWAELIILGMMGLLVAGGTAVVLMVTLAGNRRRRDDHLDD